MAKKLIWSRIPRKGFVPSHWVAHDENGTEMFSIWQKKPTWAGRQNIREAHLFMSPPLGHCGTYDTVLLAKQAASLMVAKITKGAS